MHPNHPREYAQMTVPVRAGVLVLVGCAVGCLAFVAVDPKDPTLWAPYPLLMFLLVAVVKLPPAWAAACAGIFTLIWNPKLIVGATSIPMRTNVLYWVVLVGNLLFLGNGVLAWSAMLHDRGLVYILTVYMTNGVFALLAYVLLRLARKQPSYWRSLVAHTILMTWTFWYACPWIAGSL